MPETPGTIEQQINALQRMTTTELVARFAEVHGYPCRTRHRAYLIRKIAWRIQANAEGDLSERARGRDAEKLSTVQVHPASGVFGTSARAGRHIGEKPPRTAATCER
ncbi:MAG TPA: DUF2924 domain-containing protein [Phycisphaerales bacterium]|nr:DUF2924 domain-containing protein [Phycisphaerales bacterium]